MFLLLARRVQNNKRNIVPYLNRIVLQKCSSARNFLYEYAVDICSYLNFQSCGYCNQQWVHCKRDFNLMCIKSHVYCCQLGTRGVSIPRLTRPPGGRRPRIARRPDEPGHLHCPFSSHRNRTIFKYSNWCINEVSFVSVCIIMSILNIFLRLNIIPLLVCP